MSAEEQKSTFSYNHTQSTNFSNTPNSRVKAAYHLNTCSYAKIQNQSCLPVFKLDPQDAFSILSGVIIEEVAVSKSVSNRARN